jgi:hypothetical protein
MDIDPCRSIERAATALYCLALPVILGVCSGDAARRLVGVESHEDRQQAEAMRTAKPLVRQPMAWRRRGADVGDSTPRRFAVAWPRLSLAQPHALRTLE